MEINTTGQGHDANPHAKAGEHATSRRYERRNVHRWFLFNAGSCSTEAARSSHCSHVRLGGDHVRFEAGVEETVHDP